MEKTSATFAKTINGETYEYTRDQVSLCGKIHDASATRQTRNNAGETVALPACGQRSRRFHPTYILVGFNTDCEKCLNLRAEPLT